MTGSPKDPWRMKQHLLFWSVSPMDLPLSHLLPATASSFTLRGGCPALAVAAALVQPSPAAGTARSKSGTGAGDGVGDSRLRVPAAGQEMAPVCGGQRHLCGTVWEKRLSLHAGRMPSDGDCSGEICVRMSSQCSCSPSWESVSAMALWQEGGRVREKCNSPQSWYPGWSNGTKKPNLATWEEVSPEC